MDRNTCILANNMWSVYFVSIKNILYFKCNWLTHASSFWTAVVFTVTKVSTFAPITNSDSNVDCFIK